jgi:hypothetical protein
MITILLQLVIAAIILGLIIWLASMIPGLDPAFINIVRVVAIVIFVIYVIYILMELLGGAGHLPALK